MQMQMQVASCRLQVAGDRAMGTRLEKPPAVRAGLTFQMSSGRLLVKCSRSGITVERLGDAEAGR
jgi:hypothetical protein